MQGLPSKKSKPKNKRKEQQSRFVYIPNQADSKSEVSNQGIQFNPKINEELSRVHVTPKNSSITTQKSIFSLRVLGNGFPELSTRESLYNVEPYNFADHNISQFLENTLSDKELHEFLLAYNVPDNFMKKPANTSFFFAGGKLRPDQFKAIDRNFYTESDIKFLLSNLKTGYCNVCTRTRDLQKIVCDKYGAIDTNAFLPYVQNAQGARDSKETFWQTISRYQAKGCEGEVLAMLGHNKNDKNIWETIEKPELLKNPKVTIIIEISPEQPKLPTRIIFPHGLTEQIKFNYAPMFDNINIKSEDRDKILVLDFEIAKEGREYKYEISEKDTVILKKGEFELIDKGKTVNKSPSVKPFQKLALYKESFTIQSDLPRNEKKSVLAQEGI